MFVLAKLSRYLPSLHNLKCPLEVFAPTLVGEASYDLFSIISNSAWDGLVLDIESY